MEDTVKGADQVIMGEPKMFVPEPIKLASMDVKHEPGQPTQVILFYPDDDKQPTSKKKGNK